MQTPDLKPREQEDSLPRAWVLDEPNPSCPSYGQVLAQRSEVGPMAQRGLSLAPGNAGSAPGALSPAQWPTRRRLPPVISSWTETSAMYVYASFAKNHLREFKGNDFILLDLGFLIRKPRKSSLILLNLQETKLKSYIRIYVKVFPWYKHTFGKTTFNQNHKK